jgi:membrane associated rhomboid family serine protease
MSRDPMADLVLFEFAAVGVIAAFMAAVVLRKRSFVLLATLAMFAVTALEVIPGVLPRNASAFPDLAWRYTDLFEPLQWYRLATHLFVHDATSPAHIVGNAFTLVLLGWPLEEKIGWKLTMAVFFLTGMVGAVLSSIFVIGIQDPVWIHAIGYGASGSIFGLIGYFAVRYPREQVYAPVVVILMRVPVTVAAVAALAVQAFILLQINNPVIGALPWPSVLAHMSSFAVGVAATRVPGLRSSDTPKERAFHLDLAPLRELAVKPSDKMEVEGIIKEDIPEVAQAKLEAFVKRARCPKCEGVLELKAKKLTSACGWSLEFGRRTGSAGKR